MEEIGVFKVRCAHEERFQALLRTRDNGRVVAEEQTAQYGYEHDAKKI